MRTIPIYDTSFPDFLRNHHMKLDIGFIGDSTFHIYLRKICEEVSCSPSQHMEISRNSDQKMGRKIRTASLKLKKGDKEYFAESLYQGSKIFKNGENNHYLYEKSGDESLKVKATWKGRRVIGIDFFGHLLKTECLTDLHDLVYWLGLEHTYPQIDKALSILKKKEVNYFTDCFDSPGKNSQSQSFAKYYWLWKNGESVWDYLTKEQTDILKIVKDDSNQKNTAVIQNGNIVDPLF